MENKSKVKNYSFQNPISNSICCVCLMHFLSQHQKQILKIEDNIIKMSFAVRCTCQVIWWMKSGLIMHVWSMVTYWLPNKIETKTLSQANYIKTNVLCFIKKNLVISKFYLISFLWKVILKKIKWNIEKTKYFPISLLWPDHFQASVSSS